MALPPIAVTEVALGGISRYYNISDSSMCSDGDRNNGGDEDCDSGESFSDEFISFPVVTTSLMVIYEYWQTWDN